MVQKEIPAVPAAMSKDKLRQILKKEYENPTTFVDKLRKEFDYKFAKIDKHPFLTEIEKGELPREKYNTYAIQNYFYFLAQFRNTSIASGLADDLFKVQLFLDWGKGWTPEFEKYKKIIKNFGVTESEMEAVLTDPTVPLPASRAYADYGFYIYSTGTLGEIACTTFPCAWTYSAREIGGVECPLRVGTGLAKYYGVDKKLALSYGNYSRQQPHLAVLKNLKDIINYEAEKGGKEIKAKIRDVFSRCLDYEYKWWDTAYRHEPGKEVEIGSYF